MIRPLIICFLALWPIALEAQTVVVRSGEHPGYSRLVLEFAERPEWGVQLADREAKIVLPDAAWQFETDRVFSRIPRTRIMGLVAMTDGLVLQLGCGCRVTAFEVRSGALAIDIADPAPRDRNPERMTASDTGSDAADPDPTAVPEVMSIAPSAPSILGSIRGDSRMTRFPDAPTRARMMTLQEPSAMETSDFTVEAPPSMNTEVIENLAEGIARAATQGILRLAPSPRDRMADLPIPTAAAPEPENLRLRLPGETAWLPSEVPIGHDCRGDDAYDVSAWGAAEQGAAEAIGALRTTLAADLDSFDEGRVIDLARLYISLGFGAEAIAALEAMAPRHPETALLSALARVVDGDPADIAALEPDCPGRAQLWATLATGKVNDPEAVSLAVLELPLTLRRHLAPSLISAALAVGDTSTAEVIRAAIERAAGPHGVPFDLAAARIDADRTVDQGLRKIQRLAAEPSPVSDDALILLLDIANENGRTVEAATLAHAATRADDLRGTTAGMRLEMGVVLALLAKDDFDGAVLRLSGALADSLPRAEVSAMAEAVLSALAERGSDEALLVHSAALRGELSGMVEDGSVRAAISSRLLDLGLPRLARDYLPDLSFGQPAVVLAARERSLSGDVQGALSGLESVTEPDRATLLANAEALGSLGREGEETMIRRTLENAEAPDGDEGLADDTGAEPGEGKERPGSPRELVVASEEARRDIDAMLAEFPRP